MYLSKKNIINEIKSILEQARELSLNARGVDKAKEILKEMTK